jgi:hypothetical protein
VFMDVAYRDKKVVGVFVRSCAAVSNMVFSASIWNCAYRSEHSQMLRWYTQVYISCVGCHEHA